MSRIVIIDIDANRPSYYALQIANSFKHLDSDVKISLLTVSSDKFLASANVFDQIVSIPEEAFEMSLKSIFLGESSSEIENLIAPLSSVHWDFIFNFSRHPFGVLISKFLKASEHHGPYMKDDGDNIRYSNYYSFLHFNQPSGVPLPLHKFQFYKGILDFKEPVKLFKLNWANEVITPVLRKIDEMRMSTQRKKIVLIDSQMGDSDNPNRTKFVSGIFLSVLKYTDFLPVLFTENADDSVAVVDDIQKFSPDKVYLVTLKDSARATFFSFAEAIVTDDLKHAEVADLVLRPSILLSTSKKYDFSLSSSCPGSILMMAGSLDLLALKRVQSAITFVVNNETKHSSVMDVSMNAYQTLEEKAATVLNPVDTDGKDPAAYSFLKWNFISRFIMSLSGDKLPATRIIDPNYPAFLKTMKDKTSAAQTYVLGEKSSVSISDSTKLLSNTDQNGVFGYILLYIHYQREMEVLGKNDLVRDLKFGMDHLNKFLQSEDKLFHS